MIPIHKSGFECENCGRDPRRHYDICPHCGFPMQGTKSEKETFYNKVELIRTQLKELKEEVFDAKLAIWTTATVNFLYAIVNYFVYSGIRDSELILIINILVSFVFFLLGLASNEKPFSALVVTLICYGALFLYRIIDDQPGMMLSLFTRDLTVIGLIKGISSSREIEELQKQLKIRSRP